MIHCPGGIGRDAGPIGGSPDGDLAGVTGGLSHRERTLGAMFEALTHLRPFRAHTTLLIDPDG